MGQTYPLPITAAMLAPANLRAGMPRYNTPGDWYPGAVGNDVDTATATSPAVGSAAPSDMPMPYAPKTQTAKAALMTPPLTVLSDLGIDYGEFAGEAGRDGTIEPGTPYPETSPEPTPGEL